MMGWMMDRQTDVECLHELMDGRMNDGCVDRWTDGWMYGWALSTAEAVTKGSVGGAAIFKKINKINELSLFILPFPQ